MVVPVPVRAFLPLVAPWLPHAPMPLVERAIRSAAIEFCERTRCWRHITTLTMTGQGEAAVAPDYAAIFEFETATFNGGPLTPVQYSDVSGRPLQEGTPAYITQVSPNTVTLIPFATGEIDLALFLKPRGDSDFARPGMEPLADYYDQVPDFLLSQDGEAIARGAIGRVMSIPGEPFSDLIRAGSFLTMFDAACAGRFSANIRGQQRAPRRTRPRYF